MAGLGQPDDEEMEDDFADTMQNSLPGHFLTMGLQTK